MVNTRKSTNKQTAARNKKKLKRAILREEINSKISGAFREALAPRPIK